MFDNLEILERIYFRNTVLDYVIAFGSILLGFLLIVIFKRVILQKVEKLSGNTNTRIDDYLVHGMERFGIPALYITVVYSGLTYLTLNRKFENILKIAITVLVTYLVIRIVSTIILMLLQSYVRRQDRGEEKVKELGGLMIIINVIIWGVGLLSLLDNLGYDVTTVIAGLGIGGVAIALASQNILGDLFNYFVIFFDRPFETGDFITIDNKMGVVDYIGVKSTRINSLTGEQLIFSNSDLTKSRIHNYKRMVKRRVLFKFGITYQTPLENVKKIPGIIKSIITSIENTTFDRAHFAAYGESSLDFEVVYYVMSSDYNAYMDIQQSINLQIYEEFLKMGVQFAHPTRTLYVTDPNADNKRNKRDDSHARNMIIQPE